jgi:hypothetical protein
MRIGIDRTIGVRGLGGALYLSETKTAGSASMNPERAARDRRPVQDIPA